MYVLPKILPAPGPLNNYTLLIMPLMKRNNFQCNCYNFWSTQRIKRDSIILDFSQLGYPQNVIIWLVIPVVSL